MMGFLREVTEIKYIRRFSAHNYYFTICRFTHKHLFQSQVKYVSLKYNELFYVQDTLSRKTFDRQRGNVCST